MYRQLTTLACSRRRARYSTIWLLATLLAMPAPAARADYMAGYDFPITDPFEATVCGTPVELKHRFRNKEPMRQDSFELEVFPGR